MCGRYVRFLKHRHCTLYIEGSNPVEMTGPSTLEPVHLPLEGSTNTVLTTAKNRAEDNWMMQIFKPRNSGLLYSIKGMNHQNLLLGPSRIVFSHDIFVHIARLNGESLLCQMCCTASCPRACTTAAATQQGDWRIATAGMGHVISKPTRQIIIQSPRISRKPFELSSNLL